MNENKNNNKDGIVEFAKEILDENNLMENKDYPAKKPDQDVRFNPNKNRKEIDVVTSENQLR